MTAPAPSGSEAVPCNPQQSPAGVRREQMPPRTAALGDYGERLAARYLREHGFEVLDTKWRCRDGEIDIVATEGSALVVCEVKTRRHEAFGHPREAVTVRKLARLRRLAAQWLDHQQHSFGDIRIDVVAVLRPPHGAAVVEHLRGVG